MIQDGNENVKCEHEFLPCGDKYYQQCKHCGLKIPDDPFNKFPMEHFCDNPGCPNHSLFLNPEKHYHPETEVGTGGIGGVLYAHTYIFKRKVNYRQVGWRFFTKVIYDIKEERYHFCDICHYAIQRTHELGSDYEHIKC